MNCCWVTMVLFLIVAITVLVGAFSYWQYLNCVRKSKLGWMPGEPGFPIIGIISELKKNTEVINVLGKYSRKHKGLCWVNVLTLLILATDYKFLEFTLTSNQLLDKGRIYGFLVNWLGKGLLTAPGTKWKTMRKILTPAFHFSILEQFIAIFESNVDTLVSLLKKESNKGIVDIAPFITTCTLDNICETAMGIKMNAQIDPNSKYIKLVKEMCYLTIERSKSIIRRFDLTYPLSKNYYKEKQIVKILQRYTDKVIDLRRKELKKENSETEADDLGRKKKMAFLDILLKATLDGKPLSNKTVRDEVNTFMFAGHDTTASTICSTIYCLANHPEVQEKALKEQRLIFGDNMDRPATFRDLQEMKYLENVIKETLRLYPTVPFISRYVDKDIQYEEGKIIPAGAEILIFIQGVNRNPEVFSEPDRFDPERFENISGIHPYSYIPFSAGPRNCIGQKFAMLEVKSIVSKLIRNFHIGPPGAGYEPIFTSELVFHSMNGMNVVLKERYLRKTVNK